MQEILKNRLLHVWVTIGESWSRESARNAKNRLLLVLGHDRVLSSSVSRQE